MQIGGATGIAMRATETKNTPNRDPRGISILAKSLVRDMREQGFSHDQIINLSTELLHAVSADIRSDIEQSAVAAAE